MKYTQPLNEEENASFVDGNPATGLTGSIIPAGALENPQREIVNVITSAGLTPSASSNTQLAQAISTLINNSASGLQTKINNKANDSEVVKLSGNQTINNTKTYAASPLVPNITAGDSSKKSANTAFVSNAISAVQTQIDVHTTAINGKQATVTGAATTITDSNLTASRALIANSNGKVAVSSTTDTEIGYVHGVTSAIQTQIDNRITTTISKAANGYWKDNKNGLIIQWGRILVKDVTNMSSITTITLPTSFTNTDFSFAGTFENNTSTNPSVTDDVTFCITAISKTQVKGFGFDAGGNHYDAYMRWIAVGY